MPATVKPEWISVGHAARILGVSPPTVWHMIREGYLTTRKVGHWTRVDAREVERIDRQATQPATAGIFAGA
jgi:excisionase family DNA binding protein